MKRLVLVIQILSLIFLSCKHLYSQGHINPQARKLNDSAFRIWKNFPYPSQKTSKKADGKPIELLFDSIENKSFTIDSAGTYKKLMSLLNQALKIDSNYITAYISKFSYQGQWKKHTDAIVTGEKLLSFFPNDPMIKFALAEQYDNIGDAEVAKKYYNDVLTVFNKALDTMSVNNRNRRLIELDKAEVLILLNRNASARSLLKELYDEETDDLNKQTLRAMMNRTREQILSGEALEITDN